MSWTRIDGDDLVTLEIAKAHLRVDHTEEDVLISSYIKAAIDAAESFCRRPLLPGTYQSDDGEFEVEDVPESIKIAVLLLVGHYYANREAVTFGTPSKIPFGVESLLWPYRELSF